MDSLSIVELRGHAAVDQVVWLEQTLMELVAVLANPALSDFGFRTRARVELAAEIIGCHEATIVNLFPMASRSSLSIAEMGGTVSPWLAARADISGALANADEILFGFGVTSPSGPAGAYYRAQVAWTKALVARAAAPPWMVGGQPRHPSRWQRHTSRAFPALAFADALRLVLCQECTSGGRRS
jgi:hypothetical protein